MGTCITFKFMHNVCWYFSFAGTPAINIRLSRSDPAPVPAAYQTSTTFLNQTSCPFFSKSPSAYPVNGSWTTHGLISVRPGICRQLRNQSSVKTFQIVSFGQNWPSYLYPTTLSSFSGKEGQLLIPNFSLCISFTCKYFQISYTYIYKYAQVF